MNLFAITSLLCGVFCFVLAVFAFIAGKNRIYKLVALYNVAVCVWGIGSFFVAVASDPKDALLGWKVAHFGGFFVSAFFFHLVSEICENRNFLLIGFGYFQAVIYNLLNFSTDWMMKPLRQAFGFYYIDRTYLSSMAFVTYFFLIFLSYVQLSKYLMAVKGERRLRAQAIFFGFLFGFIGGTSILLPEFRIDVLYPFGNIGVFIYAAILTYVLLRSKVLDLEEIIQAVRRDKLAAIGTLAASMNHEIRNPLYVIQGLAEAHLSSMEEGRFPDAQAALQRCKEILQKTAEQSTRAMDIMKSFSLFAKQGVDSQTKKEKLNLEKVIGEILPLVRYELALDKIELNTNIPKTLYLDADKRHLEEIFFNLIVNACQAMKQAAVSGEISIRAEQLDDSICVEISDNGPGMDKDQIGKIFEPFYTTKQEGTGLGLYITKQLIERNGGKIAVKSKLGRGTTFTLEFKQC